MISRALERQIDDFVSLLEAHLARMIEIIQRRTRRLKPADRDRTVNGALVLAFRRREELDPRMISVVDWFDECVQEARYSDIEPSDEEKLAIKALQPEQQNEQEALNWVDSDERAKADPILKPGKDCPPCWQCRYFDGWLPRGEPKPPPVANDAGVAEAIANLNKRKIEIANYVRGNYPEELLED